jgi:hypothetical protein
MSEEYNAANDVNGNGESPEHWDDWVEYIDEATGAPYLFNNVTGESRWVELGENEDEQEGYYEEQQSPWQAYYDDDGNLFYYNQV